MKLHPAWRLFALLFGIGPAAADFKASASFVTDQVYRGYSKSRGNPAATGNLEYQHESGLYGGLWVAAVSFDDRGYSDRAEVEFNPYLGWAYRISADWHADFSVNGYLYDGKLFGRNSDFNEFHGALHFRDLLTARFAFAHDAYGRAAATFDYELVGRYFPADDWQVSVGLGFYQASELLHRDVFYWNAGLTWYPCRYLAADLRYVDSTAVGYPGRYDEFRPRPLDHPLLFTLTVGF